MPLVKAGKTRALAILNDKVANAPDIAAQLAAGGSIPVGSTPAEFRQLIITETARWQKVVQETGTKLE